MTSWKEPTPFTKDKEPPVFPVDSLPTGLSLYAKALANAYQTPVDMGAVGILATLSICVQGKFDVQLRKDWKESLNLFTLIIAKPSSLKSQVLNKLIKPIQTYERQENERLQVEIERSKLEKKLLEDDIAKLMKTRHTDEFKEIELFNKQDELTTFKELNELTLTVGDITPEALADIMSRNNNRITIFSTEGGIFNDMASGGYSKKVNLDTYLQGYSGDTVKVNRMGREKLSLDKPCLSMFLSVQPSVIDEVIGNRDFVGKGLTSRFLYCYPKSLIGTRSFERDDIPNELEIAFEKMCFQLLDMKSFTEQGAIIPIITLSFEAYNLFQLFYENIEEQLQTDLALIDGLAGKLPGQVLRIAGILHLATLIEDGDLYKDTDGNVLKEMDVKTMWSAIEIGNYFLEHAKIVHGIDGVQGYTKDAEYVLQKLLELEKPTVTRRDLQRKCATKHLFKKADDMDEPLALLQEMNYLQIEETQNKSIKITLNPVLLNK